jgi:putative membrane protein
MHHYGTWGGGWLMIFWIVLVIALIFFFVIYSRQSNQRRNKSALDILNERYARGEIDEEEYEKKKKNLTR